jgi:ribosomal protein S18 acetylase RimI-like enzyme
MHLTIRPINNSETNLLATFLYNAIFIPEGIEPPPFEIIHKDELQVYINDFGKHEGDFCLVAETENHCVAGAVWVRILSGTNKGFGNIDSATPEFAISVLKKYRNQQIGTKLMSAMIDLLKNNGYRQASLSVQKENYAVKMYQKLGFRIEKDLPSEYLMILTIA